MPDCNKFRSCRAEPAYRNMANNWHEWIISTSHRKLPPGLFPSRIFLARTIFLYPSRAFRLRQPAAALT